MRLANKVALITGGGSGIGRASAVLFAKEGAKVVVSDLNEVPALETVDLVKEAGGEAVAVTGDGSRSADAENMVRATVGDSLTPSLTWQVPSLTITLQFPPPSPVISN